MSPHTMARVVSGMNLLDIVATLIERRYGEEEFNPLMGWLLDFSPGVFIAVKFLGVIYFAEILAVLEAKRALLLLMAAYLGVLAVHLWMFMASV